MHTPIQIPLAQIDADALPRDRAALDPEPLAALHLSIVNEGLRQPIEVWEIHQPRGPHLYGLISGLRRLTTFRALAETDDRFATIPAFVRTPASIPDAMAAMIAENEVRADITPWEKGAILVAAVDEGIFPTLDAAVMGLHPHLSRQNRARLRGLAHLVEHMPRGLAAPERLTQRQCLRLTAALRADMGELIALALAEVRGKTPETQWARLGPILAEAERDPDDTVEDPYAPHDPARPRRPRRVLHLKQGLTIRRELTRGGWILRFTGPETRKGALMDDIFDQIEYLYQPG